MILDGFDDNGRLRFRTDGPWIAVTRPEVRAAHTAFVRRGWTRFNGNTVDESDLSLLLLELTKDVQARHIAEATR